MALPAPVVRDWVWAFSCFSHFKIWSWKPDCGGWSQCHQSASCFCKATDANFGKSQSYKALLQTKYHRKNSLCRGWLSGKELSGKLLFIARHFGRPLLQGLTFHASWWRPGLPVPSRCPQAQLLWRETWTHQTCKGHWHPRQNENGVFPKAAP